MQQAARRVRCPRRPVASLVAVPATLALLVAEPLLRVEARLFGRAARLRCPPLFRDDERRPHEIRQARFSALAILTLAPTIARNHPDGLLAVQARRQLLEHALALLLGERPRRPDVPQQLDARGRRVHMLPARTAGT